jgi:hypothetical protein
MTETHAPCSQAHLSATSDLIERISRVRFATSLGPIYAVTNSIHPLLHVVHAIAVPGPQVSHTPSHNKADKYLEKKYLPLKMQKQGSDRGRRRPPLHPSHSIGSPLASNSKSPPPPPARPTGPASTSTPASQTRADLPRAPRRSPSSPPFSSLESFW